VSTKSRLSRRPLAFWPGVKSQNTTIRHVIGVIEHDVLPLVLHTDSGMSLSALWPL